LAGLYGVLEAASAFLNAPLVAGRTAPDQPAKGRLIIAAAQAFELFAAGIGGFQAELEMLTEGTFDPLEFGLAQKPRYLRPFSH
jgi:hypothetical protein